MEAKCPAFRQTITAQGRERRLRADTLFCRWQTRVRLLEMAFEAVLTNRDSGGIGHELLVSAACQGGRD